MSARHLFATFLIAVTLLFLPLLTPTLTHAQDFGFEWTGVCVGGEGNDVATIQGIECLMANVLSVFIALIGLAAFVMIVAAAFRYLLSGGNTKGTEQARNTVTFAIVGIVVALSAFIILNLLTAFTGVDLTKFVIPRDTTNFPEDGALGGGTGGFN
jgi:hypothetical protein